MFWVKVLTSEMKDVGLVIMCIWRAFASKLFPLFLPSSLLSWRPTLLFFLDRQAPKSLFCHEQPSYFSFPSSGNFRSMPCAQCILFSSEYSKTSAKHCFSCWLYSKHGSARWVPTEVEIRMTGVTTKRRVISHLPLSTSFLGTSTLHLGSCSTFCHFGLTCLVSGLFCSVYFGITSQDSLHVPLICSVFLLSILALHKTVSSPVDGYLGCSSLGLCWISIYAQAIFQGGICISSSLVNI